MSQTLMGSSNLMGNLFTPESAGEMANLRILLLVCFACLFVYLGKLKITQKRLAQFLQAARIINNEGRFNSTVSDKFRLFWAKLNCP